MTLRGTPARISVLDTGTFAVRLVNIPGHTTTGHHWLSANGKYSFVAVERVQAVWPSSRIRRDRSSRTIPIRAIWISPTCAARVFYQPAHGTSIPDTIQLTEILSARAGHAAAERD